MGIVVAAQTRRSAPTRLGAALMSPVTWGPLRREPDQTPGEVYFEHLPAGLLFLWEMERDHPAGMVDAL